MANLYFVTRDDKPEQAVTKEEFVRAERQAGFHNTMGQPKEPATSGFFSGSKYQKISGRIQFV